MYYGYKLTWENWKGDSIDLTDERGGIYLDRVEGLHPVKAEHSTAVSPYRDGERLTNVRIGVRNIVAYFNLCRNVEENKALLYRLFRKKKEGTLRYKRGDVDVYAKAYVEDITPNQYENPVSVQIVLVCFDPYFISAQEILTEIGQNVPRLRFVLAMTQPQPFGIYNENTKQTINNDGDVELGMLIQIYASGRAEIPKIYNELTGEYFELQLELFSGDKIEINTNDGEHAVTLIRAAERFNVFNLLSRGSSWLKLDVGENTFGATASMGEESLVFKIIAAERYEGV